MRRWLVVLLVIAAVVVALRFTVFAPEPVAVRTAPAARGLVESSVTNSKAGTVKARRRAKLSPGTSGIVVELAVARGDRMATGDVLLRLEADTQAAQLQLARRDLDVAAAAQEKTCIAADRAARELKRNQELVGDGLVTVDRVDDLQSALDLASADCRVAAAEVARREAAVAVAQAELDKTVLRAPFDAIVAEVSVELGEWVTPSVALLAAPDVIDAIDGASLYVSAPMDEVDADRLHAGLPVRVTVDSHPGEVFAGTLARLAPYVLDVESQNRTLEIEVELDDAQAAASLLPGTSADVEVLLETHADVLRVPTLALLEGDRVLVLEQGLLVSRALTTGLRNWDWTEVLGGLSVGEPVVLSLDRPGVEAGVEAGAEALAEPGAGDGR